MGLNLEELSPYLKDLYAALHQKDFETQYSHLHQESVRFKWLVKKEAPLFPNQKDVEIGNLFQTVVQYLWMQVGQKRKNLDHYRKVEELENLILGWLISKIQSILNQWQRGIKMALYGVHKVEHGDSSFLYNREVGRLYQEAISKIEPVLYAYQNYLLDLVGNKRLVKEKDIHPLREKINNAYENLGPFIRLIDKFYKNDPSLDPLLKQNLQALTKQVGCQFPDASQVLSTLGQYRSIIALEGMNWKQIPLGLIRKVAIDRSSLSPKQELKLKAWLTRLESRKLEVSSFHKALSALVEHFNKHRPQGTTPIDLAELEVAIQARSDVFQQRDPKHLEWRKSLVPGKTIFHYNKPLILGQPLRKITENSNVMEFTLQNQPDYTLLVSFNRAGHGLREKCMSQPLLEGAEWGIPMPQIPENGLDPKGLYVLRERVVPILEVENSNEKLQAFIGMCNRWLKKGLFPAQFSIQNIVINNKCEIRSLTPNVLLKNIEMVPLEKAIYLLAEKSLPAYQKLLASLEHPDQFCQVTKYYQAVLEYVFNDEPCPFDKLALACYKVEDEAVVAKAQKFYKKAAKILKTIQSHLEKNYKIDNPDEISALIKKTFIGRYLESTALGRFWPSFETEVTERVLSEASLKSLTT